mmetsp:Transcript_14339/g.19171  ORF Transcript_14339/g.19171 Transcript_14339/m.19171 type:complete len:596 (-) Transcript_14339:179-1966(-)|eukprot:CAMPEP_0197307364 /NCGR_PEP_ID=MMETSP0891-20130614/4984_1 /TAXON_ID=44058 ORGANISM="Aureoumbra lagunensis, Strain CCMP1510" /NCGR_SAMPLE_ID=MMETSP0891 /ASSEMBLY_ACC=CAM_ASM_000534 /LENGTH=595 /DNA_ID=CAMNT_0042790633 /DNA_START=49 /DNA_END=1836 /DNA_ORIENTATION=+
MLSATAAKVARGCATLWLVILFMDMASANRQEFVKEQYTWLIVCCGFLAFFHAYGIGANDVANAYSTSVGAKALTIRQAVVLAGIFEFSGAVLMGSSVVKTIRKGIADVECFTDNPGLLIYGMTCVILCSGAWLLIATYFEMPISTTHATVSGIIGFTLMARGKDCVIWNYTKKDYGNGTTNMGFDNFPWLDGVAEMVMSWILSPFASGICAAILYGFTYYCILIWDNSYLYAKIAFPFIVAFTTGVNVVFWIVKGTKGRPKRFRTSRLVREANGGNVVPAIIVSAWVMLAMFILSALLLIPISRRIEATVTAGNAQEPVKTVDGKVLETEEGEIDPEEQKENTEPVDLEVNEDLTSSVEVPTTEKKKTTTPMGYIFKELNKDPHAPLKNSELVGEIHSSCRRHDNRTEAFFKYVQVFTAIVDSFSHGANDVANSMGPFAAAYTAWNRGHVNSSTDLKDTMTWMLAIGGAGIVVGLGTYGYKIMSAMGVKLAAITPSRGYCIELGAAFVIIYGTAQGWPLSTTQCQIGATIAVSLFEGKHGFNKMLLLKAFFGWGFTFAICGFLTAFVVGPSPEPLKDEYCQDWARVGDRGVDRF